MRRIKRLAAVLLLAVMALSMIAVGFAAEQKTKFTDVADEAWYAEAVEYCVEAGLMNGTEEASFEPGGTMTRAMLVTALYRQAGQPAVTGTDAFSDTEADKWYSAAILWAAQQGVVKGYEDGRFGVNDPVTREQLVTTLWRIAGSPKAESGEPFADQDSISAYAVTAVDWARANNIVSGREDDCFAPRESATRAEAAALLAKQAQADRPDVPMPSPDPVPVPDPAPQPKPEPEPVPDPAPTGTRILVAYFSATGNTRPVAEAVAKASGGDLFEIVPAVPYTAEDLNYNQDCRANAEQNDPDARPAIAGSVENMDDYDVVLIGYPIWWGRAPKIIHTFLESYDMSGKTIAAFCTSGGSGHEDATIRGYEPDAVWLTGRRFSGTSQVDSWVEGLGLPAAPKV